MKSKIEGIIFNCIFTERNSTVWVEYKEKIIQNINNIDFSESIENYIPCQRKLYMTKPKMRIFLHNRIRALNNNIFKEIGHETYEPITNIKFIEICTFIEDCVKILAKKQQGKN